MEKKKGFTLVEVIGIIAIIAVILVFAIPALVGILKRNDEDEYNRFIKDICIATESYTQMHSESYKDLNNIGGTYQISMQILLEDGWIKNNMSNPKTKEKINSTDFVRITKEENGNYTCTYNE